MGIMSLMPTDQCRAVHELWTGGWYADTFKELHPMDFWKFVFKSFQPAQKGENVWFEKSWLTIRNDKNSFCWVRFGFINLTAKIYFENAKEEVLWYCWHALSNVLQNTHLNLIWKYGNQFFSSPKGNNTAMK